MKCFCVMFQAVAERRLNSATLQCYSVTLQAVAPLVHQHKRNNSMCAHVSAGVHMCLCTCAHACMYVGVCSCVYLCVHVSLCFCSSEYVRRLAMVRAQFDPCVT